MDHKNSVDLEQLLVTAKSISEKHVSTLSLFKNGAKELKHTLETMMAFAKLGNRHLMDNEYEILLGEYGILMRGKEKPQDVQKYFDAIKQEAEQIYRTEGLSYFKQSNLEQAEKAAQAGAERREIESSLGHYEHASAEQNKYLPKDQRTDYKKEIKRIWQIYSERKSIK